MRRALLSLTDKRDVVPFAQRLAAQGFQLLSTGGTAKALRDAGLAVTDVAEVTGFPEMLDGRVKTLHPLVHGGLLGDTRLESHRSQMAEAGIVPIEVVAVNLYAFEATVTKDHTWEEAIESIHRTTMRLRRRLRRGPTRPNCAESSRPRRSDTPPTTIR